MRWQLSHRADPPAVALADRHYNRQKPGSPQFVPPGRCIVFITQDEKAVWVTSYPYARYVKHAWGGAWVNSIFRNEGAGLSSELIREAIAATRAVSETLSNWSEVPDLGIITMVDPRKIRPKQDPGYCYIRAGFHRVGTTKGGLLVFQMLPDEMPEPCDPLPKKESQVSLPPEIAGDIGSKEGQRVSHPSKFSDNVLTTVGRYLAPDSLVIDPFSGVGRIHELGHIRAVGVEIEPEWARQASGPTVIGNALRLPFADSTFAAAATSPVFGNRVSDSHNAQERCKACGGTGKIEDSTLLANGDGWTSFSKPCEKCDGTGRRTYKRMTYTHQLGRPLHPDNAGSLQWSDAYRQFHLRAWLEVRRVLRPNGTFVLNISDHIRGGRRMDVARWHCGVITTLGFGLLVATKVPTPRMRYGSNREARVEHEVVYMFRAPSK